MNNFLEEQNTYRKEVQRQLKITEDQAQACYHYLRFCDELSLMLCQDDFSKSGTIVKKGGLKQIDNVTLTHRNAMLSMQPWCFESGNFQLSVEYFVVKSKYFKDDNDLKRQLNLSKPITRYFAFKK